MSWRELRRVCGLAVVLLTSIAAWAQVGVSDGAPAPEACCMLDGTCRDLTAANCLAVGGEPQGVGTACLGDWDGDGLDEICAAKWLQPPDLATTGVDIDDTLPVALADDFLCTETNAITRIIVWGSWLRDQYPSDPANVNFTLMFREDIPDPDGTGPAFSMPGKILWSRNYQPYSFRATAYRKGIQEGWWDPSNPTSYVFPGDTVCWMYVFDVPAAEAFCQQGAPGKPIVYWLDVQATMTSTPGPAPLLFGWKTSTKHWNDAAVWQGRNGPAVTPFHELRYPAGHPWAKQPIDLAFELETEPCVGACCLYSGCTIISQMMCDWGVWMGPGTNCDDLDGDGVADVCEPIAVRACCFPDGTCQMWSPADCSAAGGTSMGLGVTCTPNPCQDLLGACCYGEQCVITTEVSCDMPVAGLWMGPDSDCSDVDGDGVADVCETPLIQACCFLDGTCSMLSPTDCRTQGGTPMGAGVTCTPGLCPILLGACCYDFGCVITTEVSCDMPVAGHWIGPGSTCDDLDGDGMADVCEPELWEACCLPDGACKNMTPTDCVAAGGEPQGPASACIGDWDGDQRDDACDAKWIQPPDVAMTGIDIMATRSIALADDFLCTESNAITRIILWGSWWRDQYPIDPGNVSFKLMFRQDVADPDGAGPGFSMPGSVLWSRTYAPHEFHFVDYRTGIREGWWIPADPTSYVFPGDTVCWMYIFDIPADEAFCQQGSATKPIVYWLDVQATIPDIVLPYAVSFGWKTTASHWNDDAVWQGRTDTAITPFHELRYPDGHPWAGKSMDLAFALQAEPCVGACCLVSGCSVTTHMICEFGDWMGPGTNCDDLDGDGWADVCEPVVRQACCFLDGACTMLTSAECQNAGGTPMGPGVTCTPNPCDNHLGACCYDFGCVITTEISCDMPVAGHWMGVGTDCEDLDGDGVADICETAVYQACCMKDGTCSMLTEVKCREAGGTPQGPGSACVGDLDGDKRDEACDAKWIEPPDLAKTGIDVNDSFPLKLADDFLCTETNAITRIYVWGSWRDDMFPYDPANISFHLAIHADIPDPDGDGPAYSIPGEVVWKRDIKAYDFTVRPFQEKIQEGFWDPARPDSYMFPGDTVCWLYTFDIPVTEAFCQRGSATRPIVYWLSIQATPGAWLPPMATYFGWKSSTRHWNDDAVYCQDTGTAVTPWFELRYPEGHPWVKQSMDLAFALETMPCVWQPTESK